MLSVVLTPLHACLDVFGEAPVKGVALRFALFTPNFTPPRPRPPSAPPAPKLCTATQTNFAGSPVLSGWRGRQCVSALKRFQTKIGALLARTNQTMSRPET